jgi:hypothetical protein
VHAICLKAVWAPLASRLMAFHGPWIGWGLQLQPVDAKCERALPCAASARSATHKQETPNGSWVVVFGFTEVGLASWVCSQHRHGVSQRTQGTSKGCCGVLLATVFVHWADLYGMLAHGCAMLLFSMCFPPLLKASGIKGLKTVLGVASLWAWMFGACAVGDSSAMDGTTPHHKNTLVT